MIEKHEFNRFITGIVNDLNNIVFREVNDAIEKKPELRNHINPAFPYPRELRIGLLRNCLAVEYIGPEILDSSIFKTSGIYLPNHNVFDFLGIEINHLPCISMPMSENIDNTAFFLGESISYLCDYFYDFTQMPSELIQLNGYIDFSEPVNPIYISNTTFFWTDSDGTLKIRHIDFLEIFPYTDEGVGYHDIKSLEYFASFIINYTVPTYKIELHRKLNEFIEFINLPDISEPDITKYLEKNPEILQISFGAHNLNPQTDLIWQYDTDKPNLKPDFLIEKMDGFCDILEFKLPKLKSKPIVGTEVRQHPSFEIDSAIAQINEYDYWFAQEVNRRWLEENKGIRVLNPIKHLVIGHSDEFNSEDRRKLRSTRGISVFTYDEFIELARFQIYRIR
jgi:hypothetical protein